MAICISRWWIHYWHGSGKSRKMPKFIFNSQSFENNKCSIYCSWSNASCTRLVKSIWFNGYGKSRKIIVGKAIKALLSYFQDLRSSNLIGWVKVTRTTWPFQWLHYGTFLQSKQLMKQFNMWQMVQNRDNQWIRCTTLRFKCLNLFSTVSHLKITNALS
jgi:hypothetical protein